MKIEIEQSKSTRFRLDFKKLDLSRGIVSVINEGICELQGTFAQYFLIASEKHKQLRQIVTTYKKLEEGKRSSYVDNINEKYKNLIDYLNTELDKASQITEKYLLKYFDGQSKYPPRFCVKIPYGKHGENIIDFYRKSYCPIQSFKVEDNTAFLHFKQTGKFYVCNNIPEAIKKGEYKNLRINIESVKSSYSQPNFVKKIWYLLTEQPEHDEVWRGFWSQNEESLTSEYFYKSTLVIPMTLINTPLSFEFYDIFFDDISDSRDKTSITEKYKKLAFGFICIDHRHTEYFYPEIDVRIGYIFADMLSLFFIIRRLFINRSNSFKYAKAIVEKENV